jgi:transposase
MPTQVIPDVKKATLRGIVNQVVEKGSTVSTDELISYNLLSGDGYAHGAVDHSRKEWAWTDYQTGARHHTNSVEISVASARIHIREKSIGRYLGEFQFRSNRRGMRNAMFDLLIAAL